MITSTRAVVRPKISTTVARENYEFLQKLVASGRVANLSEGVNAAIEHLRRIENRRRLAAATARYFGEMSPDEMAEENALAREVAGMGSEIDFDREL
jgi:Arc/MetJ-type ribon-helix-helix transcriptional regulator